MCRSLQEKTRRQTVSAKVLRLLSASHLSAVSLMDTGIISFSSKGVSQGGSAAHAGASKAGSLGERRVHVRTWMRVSL